MTDIPGEGVLARLLGGRQARANARAQALGFRNDYALRQARKTATGRRQVEAGERRLRTALGGRSTRGRSLEEIRAAGQRAEAARARRSARARGVTRETASSRGVRTRSERTAMARLREAAREGRVVIVEIDYGTLRREPSPGAIRRPGRVPLFGPRGPGTGIPAAELLAEARAGGLYAALQRRTLRSSDVSEARDIQRVHMTVFDEERSRR